MHTTKTEILALLKRSDGATVDDIASSLGLAPMTVRQHLTALERDDLVQAREVRRTTGRPHYRYSLTDEGHRSVAQGYDRMVTLLVEAAGMLDPELVAGATPAERRGSLFRLAAAALAEKNRLDVLALSGRAQVERVVDILRAHGGFAEWHDLGDRFEIRDFSCVFRNCAGDYGPCEWHETFLAQVMDADIRAAPATDDCAACCRYLVTSPASVRVPNRRTARLGG